MIRKNVLSTIIISLCIAAGVASVSAQGRYASVYSRADVDNFVRSLEDSSDVFSRAFNDAGGTSTAERRVVSRFENAVDQLRRNFNGGNNWWNSRNNVQGIMNEARQVNVMMNNDRFARRLEMQWRNLRRDINKLADTYDLPELAGQRGDGGGIPPIGGGGGFGQTSRPPTWARGTFYATSGPQITMTIEANGRISLSNQGQIYYGRYYRGQMYLNNDVSTVARSGNGIRTYNRNSGETTMYSRDGYGGGDGGDTDGPVSTPPTWARGTFYSTNGSNIMMSIGSDGRVSVTNTGQVYYGRYYSGRIYLNNDVSTVSRNGRGIRTYNQNNGETTDYRRQ